MDLNCIDAFFALLRVGLWEGSGLPLPAFGISLAAEKVDWQDVFQLAEEQSVVGLVAAGIEYISGTRPAKKDVLQFIGRTFQLEQKNQAMNHFISMSVEKMREAGIYTLLVKGQGVAQCYARPLWRSCGDVDFFLSDENYEKAKEFMTPLASKVETEYKSTKHLGMTIGPWGVELHGSLRMGLPKRINRVLDEIKDETFRGGKVRTWDNSGVLVFMLSPENDIVYVFVHFLNHFYKGGLGLRQICDWCRLLWAFGGTLDVKKIESLISQMGLLSEWKAFAAYAVEWLGMPVEAMPMYSDDKKWKQKAMMINRFILQVGNMGHNRDMSYYSKYPYIIRKFISMKQRLGDAISHSRIFPLNLLQILPGVLVNGVKSAIRGE